VQQELFHHLRLVLLGSDHQLRADVGVELLLAESLELHGALLEGKTLLVSVLGNLAGHVVADDGVEAGDQHERLIHESADAALS
jgi:hypothetical protein